MTSATHSYSRKREGIRAHTMNTAPLPIFPVGEMMVFLIKAHAHTVDKLGSQYAYDLNMNLGKI